MAELACAQLDEQVHLLLLRQSQHYMDLVDRINDLLLQLGLTLQPLPDQRTYDHASVASLHQAWLDHMRRHRTAEEV